MEAIGNNLSHDEGDIQVLQWQKDLLDERWQLMTKGKAVFID